MSFKVVSSKLAAEVDKELMGPQVGFTLQQLMELAGLSVAQAVYKSFPISNNKNKVLILVGPGNNGGDGLVCARHLKLLGYNPIVYYPKRSTRQEFYGQLINQLDFFEVPLLSELDNWEQYLQADNSLCIVDALFGFSFKPPIREPFNEILDKLANNKNQAPILSVDIPSGWDVDEGPTTTSHIEPSVLVSLTVPKPCSKHLDTAARHFVGGRFIPPHFAAKYGFEPFNYKQTDQILEL